MKKKILFVIDSLNSGGAEKSLVSLLSLLDFELYEVDLILFNSEGLYLPLVPKQVKILEISEFKSNDFHDILYKIRQLKNSIRLRNPYYKRKYHSAQITCKNILKNFQKKSYKYDIAIAYSQGLPTYFVAEKVNANKKICWVNTDYKKARYNPKFDEFYYKRYNNIVVVSDKNKEIFEDIYPNLSEKVKVIYDLISPSLVKEMSTEFNGYEDDYSGIRILTIGRHVEVKGYDLAIKTAKKLKDSGINFRWYSIGEGELTELLKKEVIENDLTNHFQFLGVFTNPYPFIKDCDIYCQPSRFEGFGMAIGEAKILKKPIVVTNFTTASNQITHCKNGLICDMEADSLYYAIMKLINEKELTEMIIRNNNIDEEVFEYEFQKIEMLFK